MLRRLARLQRQGAGQGQGPGLWAARRNCRRSGKGSGAATLEDSQKARLRGQALTWLRADLALRRAQLDSGKAADRQEVQAQMRHWQQDSDFAAVRGEQALAALPQEERLAWASLWRDVAALLELASRK
jgi:hypothetical protein